MGRHRLGSCNIRKGTYHVSRRLHGSDRTRVKRHYRVYVESRQSGDSYSRAIGKARRAEHSGMTKTETRRYEGRLGQIARK